MVSMNQQGRFVDNQNVVRMSHRVLLDRDTLLVRETRVYDPGSLATFPSIGPHLPDE